jgi:hypothetical protein
VYDHRQLQSVETLYFQGFYSVSFTWLANRVPIVQNRRIRFCTCISNSNKKKDEIIPESTVQQSNEVQALIPHYTHFPKSEVPSPFITLPNSGF